MKPNFLIIMSDEHGPMFSGTYGHPIVKTPNMDRIAKEGTTFDVAYCNSPLCVPSRASFMTGKYNHKVGVYDGSSPLAVDAITWPYLLGDQGYHVALSGKMHLVGPDPLHGFEEQLSEDVHLSHSKLPVQMWEKGITTELPPMSKNNADSLLTGAGAGTNMYIEADNARRRQQFNSSKTLPDTTHHGLCV